MQEKTAEPHEQLAARIIKALWAETVRCQNHGRSRERILSHNFNSGRDYRGGNALYLSG